MTRHERKITKAVYDRAVERNGHVTAEDESEVFSPAEIHGYGVYSTNVFKRDGEYYVSYELGDSCD